MPTDDFPELYRRGMSRRSAKTVTWLQSNPPLEELVEAHPAEWLRVQRDVGAVIERDDEDEIKAYIKQVSQPAAPLPGRSRPAVELAALEIRRQMTVHLLKQEILSATTGVKEGRVRFGLAAGYVAQRLLFQRDLVRKPVPFTAYRMIWPLLGRQRRLLMPLVQPRGIWCFYSRPLISRLAELIGGRSCLEIAAGDGTLSRFLADAGVAITATDDHSWSSIDFPDTVLEQDARSALRAHQPEVVVCSWPPADNPFERYVFETPSVQLYIVIGSRHETSTGNWDDYRAQDTFELAESPELSRLVLPYEVSHAVYLFTRIPARLGGRRP